MSSLLLVLMSPIDGFCGIYAERARALISLQQNLIDNTTILLTTPPSLMQQVIL